MPNKSGDIGVVHFQLFIYAFPADPVLSNENNLKFLIAHTIKMYMIMQTLERLFTKPFLQDIF